MPFLQFSVLSNAILFDFSGVGSIYRDTIPLVCRGWLQDDIHTGAEASVEG